MGQVVDRQHPHVVGVDRLGLLQVEARRVGVDVADVEGLDHLLDREDVAVGADRPAEQGEVVEQALGQEALGAVAEQAGLGVALGQLLVALAHHVGQVAEARRRLRDADLVQRVVQRDLARRAGQQVLAAQHVGDLHQRVVDRVDQGVERVAVGARDREVGHVLGVEGDLAADQVVEGDLALGHPEARHRVTARERPRPARA